ncbi:MAG: DUF427 domain-containing protein [Herminiimonas sp.]|nr:DUF427 domain-containing protein [Herminiimonas sp.]
MWQFDGRERPSFAVIPKPGQESVWDYPRPPAIVVDHRLVTVSDGDLLVAKSGAALRILETASPPTFYLPPEAIEWSLLVAIPGQSFCEWKGVARYWALARQPQAGAVGWSYDIPNQDFSRIARHVGFYPGSLACVVDGERVAPQPGGFYGGWITSELVGPFKGNGGSGDW